MSKKSLDICEKFYVECGKKNGCGKCPINKECFSQFLWGVEGLNNHTEAINTAAEKIVK